MSKTFGVSPTQAEMLTLDGMLLFSSEDEVDWSVCFAAGSGWTYDEGDERANRKTAFIDWFQLGASGGITLNTPTEVREKIFQRRLLDQPNLAPMSSSGAGDTATAVPAGTAYPQLTGD